VLINHGRIAYDGDLENLRRTHAAALDSGADLEDVMRAAFGVGTARAADAATENELATDNEAAGETAAENTVETEETADDTAEAVAGAA